MAWSDAAREAALEARRLHKASTEKRYSVQGYGFRTKSQIARIMAINNIPGRHWSGASASQHSKKVTPTYGPGSRYDPKGISAQFNKSRKLNRMI